MASHNIIDATLFVTRSRDAGHIDAALAVVRTSPPAPSGDTEDTTYTAFDPCLFGQLPDEVQAKVCVLDLIQPNHKAPRQELPGVGVHLVRSRNHYDNFVVSYQITLTAEQAIACEAVVGA